MSSFPDFSEQGYEIKRILGKNSTSGRVTYLATHTTTQRPVVIKQFQFATVGATWSDYDVYQQEMQVLQQLHHPSIPRYLDSFETPSGFCLVQEYKPASSLAEPYQWTPEEIKQIAVAILDVLAYLQSTYPPVIHRDIKPENILVERQDKLKVYLVDFGFARIGGGEVAVSSTVKGSLGFMPPEQLFNRQLTEASDLYSLGVTLICLLTQTRSTQVGDLIDSAYRINVKQLLPSLHPKFINWLQKMIAPDLTNRFNNAGTALSALQSIDVVGNPKVGKLVQHGKLSSIAKVVGLGTLGLVSLLGTISIISSISNSTDTHEQHEHHKIKRHDKEKNDRFDREDNDVDDRHDKDDDEHDDDDDDDDDD
ncbi:serine/threonine protein kinase [Scytonema sp. PRP1]|uniref:serine/threonine protein kinase n=1 Tax=Scytonema sp. PRP1 TaxID=3120513 RepID=UPI002FD35344